MLTVSVFLLSALLCVIAILWCHVSIDIMQIVLEPFKELVGTILTAYLAVRQMSRSGPPLPRSERPAGRPTDTPV